MSGRSHEAPTPEDLRTDEAQAYTQTAGCFSWTKGAHTHRAEKRCGTCFHAASLSNTFSESPAIRQGEAPRRPMQHELAFLFA